MTEPGGHKEPPHGTVYPPRESSAVHEDEHDRAGEDEHTRAGEGDHVRPRGTRHSPRRTPIGPGRALRYRLEYLAMRGALFLLRLLGEKGTSTLGQALGSLAYHVFRIRRRVTLDNLRHAFPDLSDEEIERIARRSYRHFGVVFLELAHLASLSAEQILARTAFPRGDGLDEVVARGRGGVLVTGHFGNWEMLGAALAARGHPIWVTVATQRNPWVDRWVTRAREQSGMRVLKVEDGALAMARELRKNHLVAFVADQDAGRRGVFVEFFGRPASTAVGPVRLARIRGCPIIGGYGLRMPDGSYRFEDTPHRWVRDDLPAEEAERVALEEIAGDLEAIVRRYPEQWFWMHRRWKTRPITGGAD